MSTELGIESRDNPNTVNTTDEMQDITNSNQSLDTPSRDSNATNSHTKESMIGGGINNTNNNNNTNNEYENNVLISKSKHIHSSLKSEQNPLTIARERKLKEGQPLMVNFDERVVVHTVPYWDPCGETFYDTDDEDGPRGPNCCIIL
eukprot:496791_1